jgi:hypothetical protein
MRPNSISKSIPRTNQSDRQLRRFYEPLILLYTLGSTRGVNTPAVYLNQEDITHMPVQDVRRRFLGELAYACDYDKGGDTVTAIGLEATPQHHIYWLASNSRQEKKIVPFLQSLLTKMRDVSTVTTPVTPEIINDVAAQCIDFSTPRIKKYKSHLSAELRKCQIFLRRLDEEDGAFNILNLFV